ncbi:hypothetical protein Acr_00g0048040 [Actinidia rufa]|uniref:Uncharacterized protein n=1 Tax=Actinidia rufa TaxID=165716 RepID=A0A7J0DJX0_9ERIC|nr:hypothetical protein Acr_00g0048040 [Actinidia rufa]
MVSKFGPLGPFAAKVDSRQRKVMVRIPWKLIGRLCRVKLGVYYQLIHLCPQKFYNVELLSYQVLGNKLSVVILPVSDIVDLNLVRVVAALKPELNAWLDALAILLLNKLYLGACPYALTAVSVSRRLTQLCPYGLAAVSPRSGSSVVIALSLLSSDSSELMMALARMAIVFDSDCSELRCEGPRSLLCRDNLVEISALVGPMLECPCLAPAQGTTKLAK